MHYKVNLVCIGRLANLFIYLFIYLLHEHGVYCSLKGEYITLPPNQLSLIGLISTVAEFLRAYVRKIYVRK